MARIVSRKWTTRTAAAVTAAAGLLAVGASANGAVVVTLGPTGESPSGIVLDTQGNVYTSNLHGDSVTKITPQGESSTLAHLGTRSLTNAIAIDASGNLYTPNYLRSRITKITPDGATQDFAALPDNSGPEGMVIDGTGTLFTANYSASTVSKIAPNGQVSTLASLASNAKPQALALDASGNVFTSDRVSGTVTRVTPQGTVTTVATVQLPAGLIADPAGNVYVADQMRNAVVKVTPAGVETTLATLPSTPRAFTMDADANLYVDTSDGVTKITPTGTATVLATVPGLPVAITGDAHGNLYTANWHANTVAKIVQATWMLEVSLDGAGAGVVTSNPAGIACGATCTAEYSEDTQVVLTASPADGAAFMGWTGACTGQAVTCTVTMGTARAVTARFEPLPPSPYALRLSKSGAGTVTSAPAGINCGSDCHQQFARGAFVTLFADPADDARFASWGGDCSGTSAKCTLWMTGDRGMSARFEALPRDAKYLGVSKLGTGHGTVTSSPPGIDCGADCAQGFVDGTKVTLKAMPADDSRFAGWSGACSGATATCVVTMNAARSVSATFAALPPGSPVLTVTRTSTGAGTVTSSPVGIDCGTDCRQGYLQGAKVTLTAAPGAGATFDGWSGGCGGSALTCALTMDAAKDVDAAFTQVATLTTATSRVGPKKAVVTSQLQVEGAAKVSQRATTGDKKLTTWCRASRTATAATTLSLTCDLGAKGRNALRKGPLKLTLRSTVTPTSGKPVEVNRLITIKRKK